MKTSPVSSDYAALVYKFVYAGRQTTMSTLRIIDKSNFPNKPLHSPTAAEKLALRQAAAVACGESGEVDYEQWCPVDPVTGGCAGDAESGPPLRSGNACYDRSTIHTIMTERGNPGFNKGPLTRRTYDDGERAVLGLGPSPVLTHTDVLSQQGLLNEEPHGVLGSLDPYESTPTTHHLMMWLTL